MSFYQRIMPLVLCSTSKILHTNIAYIFMSRSLFCTKATLVSNVVIFIFTMRPVTRITLIGNFKDYFIESCVSYSVTTRWLKLVIQTGGDCIKCQIISLTFKCSGVTKFWIREHLRAKYSPNIKFCKYWSEGSKRNL